LGEVLRPLLKRKVIIPEPMSSDGSLIGEKERQGSEEKEYFETSVQL